MAEVKEKELVNHQKHYNIEGRKECIEEMIDKWGQGLIALVGVFAFRVWRRC